MFLHVPGPRPWHDEPLHVRRSSAGCIASGCIYPFQGWRTELCMDRVPGCRDLLCYPRNSILIQDLQTEDSADENTRRDIKHK